jgi:macrolide transport system ATP-binding/permease protein
MTTLRLRAIARHFAGPPPSTALQSVNLDLQHGDFLAVEGPSGGGKSTLLNVIGLLDRPSEGTYLVDDIPLEELTSRQAAELRSSLFAFVFQGFHLMDQRPVLHSVELGLLYRAVPVEERRTRAREALRAVGLEHVVDQRAATLSGGEKQRVAIARALATGAPIILADEPTGNLDSVNSAAIVDCLRSANSAGATIVLITHSPEVAEVAPRRARMRDGVLTEQTPRPEGAPASLPTVPPGTASRVRWLDVLRDAAASLLSRRGRTIGLSLAVSMAVALAIGSLGIATSARSQVAETFDAHANREVSAEWLPSAHDLGHEQTIVDRFTEQAGVDAAVVLEEYSQREVRATSSRSPLFVTTFVSSGNLEDAARLDIEWISGVSQDHSVVLGQSLADQLDIGLLAEGPSILIDGRHVPVAGIIRESPRVPLLLGAAIIGDELRASDWISSRGQALVVTSSGAAQQVARLAPLLVDPIDPSRVSVFAPIDPTTLRLEVEQDVLGILLAFTAISLIAASAALANAMVISVLERKHELGLRRALGARGVHLSALVLTESALVGAAGGVIGLFVGLTAILGVTLARGWIPVFDIALAPAAVAGGVLVGMLGGGMAAARATKITPSEALRS